MTDVEWTIHVDETRCVGNGECVVLAGELFDQRADDGVVVAIGQPVTAQLRARLKEAIAACPSGAIKYSSVAPEDAASSTNEGNR
jgi:ferredoxin